MKNKILENLDLLKKFHYITKAQPKVTPQGRSYNLNYYQNTLEEFNKRTNGNFCLIVRGDDDVENDFFAIPYNDIKAIFNPSTVYNDERSGSPCWKIYINTNQEIVNKDTRFDIRNYYGNTNPIPQLNSEKVLLQNSIIFAKIGWSHNFWQGFDEKGFENKEDYGYRYVKEKGIAHEWWNFFDYGEQYYYGHIQIGDKTPREFQNGLILFASVDPTTKKYMFIGFYGKAKFGTFKLPFDYTDTITDEKTRTYVKANNLFENFSWRGDKEFSTCFIAPIEFDPAALGVSTWGQAPYIYVGEGKKISKNSTKELLLKVLDSHKARLPEVNDIEKGKIQSIISKIQTVLRTYYDDNNIIQQSQVIPTTQGTGLIKKSLKSKQYIKQIILYGPPGTGKTYSSIIRAHEIIFGIVDLEITYPALQEKLRAQQKQQVDTTRISSWLNAIMLAFHEIKKEKVQVDEIRNSKIIEEYSLLTNNHTIRNTIWYTLQAESRLDSETVKQKRKTGNEYFDKDTESNWSLTEKGKIYLNSLIEDFQESSSTSISQFNFVTFHQSFSYEDFVEGIRPSLKDVEESQIVYTVKDGIFKEICKKASLDPDNNYVLIIDEINRGNISKIFGELITLLEDNKRSGEKEAITVRLPYSNQDFSIPNNVYIIGTMNSTDKSIALVDVALRRRFHFERLNVIYDLIPNDDAKTFLKGLNGIICAMKNPDFEIGHSYFLNIPKTDEGNRELKNVFTTKILPLIEEYFFNDWEALATILSPDSIRIEKRKKLVWDEDSGEFKKESEEFDKISGRCIDYLKDIFENTRKNLENQQKA